jgi:endonuclease YncB( thermonuclease family)
MSASAYIYSATVDRVVDGDTVYLNLQKVFSFPVDFGFHILDKVELTKSAIVNFRLAGINAPELDDPDPSVRAKGIAAKAELTRLLGLGPLIVQTSKEDKYRRWLAQINVVNPDQPVIDVNKAMLDGGFAVPYKG